MEIFNVYHDIYHKFIIITRLIYYMSNLLSRTHYFIMNNLLSYALRNIIIITTNYYTIKH